jgi:hypothetical protein
MARLWSCGFELQSVTNGVEFEAGAGNISIDTSVVRSGAASLRVDANGSPAYFDHFIASSDTPDLRVRAYYRFREWPNEVTPIMLAVDSIGVATASIRITTGGQLALYDQLSQTGSLSDALELNTWYCVELWTKNPTNRGAEARVDGVTFATDAALSGGERWMMLRIGAAPSGANMNPVLDMNVDDVAVNDGTGGNQDGYPGPGSIVHLRPNAAGDFNEFNGNTGGSSGVANNYTRVDEVTPDDSTSFNSATLSLLMQDSFNVTSPGTAGIGAGDDITLVQVGCRVGATTATQGARNIRLILRGQSGGTALQSDDFYVNINGWVTHSLTAPYLYRLTAYQNPQGGGTPWTYGSLGTLQVGYETVQATTNSRRVSTVWALVEYVPTSGEHYVAQAETAAEATGTALGSRASVSVSDAAASVSGAVGSSRSSGSSAAGAVESSGTATAGSSVRTTQAHGTVEATGRARGYEGLPPVDAHGSASVEGSAQASTQRNSSAALSVDAAPDVVSTRESVRSAHTGVEVSAEAEETKTAQTGLADDFRMTGLIGSDREESLVFPIQLHVEIDVPGNSWVDITADVRATEKVVISRGRANEAAHPDASTMTLKLNNRHGRYSPRNPRSPYFGRLGRNTPIRVYVTQGDITMYRFIGEVSEWPPRWDISDTDVWVNLEAAGILRRLEQNDLEYTSAYRRFVERSEPIVYWSLTNGKETGLYAPADVGRGDFKFTARLPNYAAYIVMPAWQDAELSPWMEPIVRTVGERGIAEGIVMDGSGASWCLDWVRTGPGGMDALYVTMQRGDEDVLTYYVGEDPTKVPRTIFVSRQFNQGIPADIGEVPMGGLAADEPHHMRLTVVQEGGNTTTTLYGDGRVLISDSRSGTFTGSVSSIFYEWNVLGQSGSSGMYHVGLGHISLWNYGDEPLLENSMAALRGHAGEVSGRRIERLCREEGVDLDVIGNLDDTGRVGPQRLAPFLTLVRQSAEVDGGILMESRVRNALLYRTNRSRYNQKEG